MTPNAVDNELEISTEKLQRKLQTPRMDKQVENCHLMKQRRLKTPSKMATSYHIKKRKIFTDNSRYKTFHTTYRQCIG